MPNQLHYSDKTSFAPRLGFAWRPFHDDKTVIRGGYGKFIEAMLGTLTSAGWGVQSSYIGTFTNTIVNGKPTLTTVIEVVQFKPLSEVLAPCAGVTGAAVLSCFSSQLEKPGALWDPFPFPEANAHLCFVCIPPVARASVMQD